MTQLLVPVTGMVRVPADPHLDGHAVTLEVTDPHYRFDVEWSPHGGDPNPRARAMLAEITGLHVEFVGDVQFCGLSGEMLTELMSASYRQP